MKHLNKILLLSFLMLIGIISTGTITKADEPTPVKILFIGNSQTYYNDMPLIVEGLAKADGMNYQVQSITASNYKLSQYATTGNAYNTIIVNTFPLTILV